MPWCRSPKGERAACTRVCWLEESRSPKGERTVLFAEVASAEGQGEPSRSRCWGWLKAASFVLYCGPVPDSYSSQCPASGCFANGATFSRIAFHIRIGLYFRYELSNIRWAGRPVPRKVCALNGKDDRAHFLQVNRKFSKDDVEKANHHQLAKPIMEAKQLKLLIWTPRKRTQKRMRTRTKMRALLRTTHHCDGCIVACACARLNDEGNSSTVSVGLYFFVRCPRDNLR